MKLLEPGTEIDGFRVDDCKLEAVKGDIKAAV